MHSSPSTPLAEPSSSGVSSQKLAIWLLLGSEAVFFSALIVTYVVFHGRGTSGPTSHQVLDVSLTAVNTFVLICSSLTMVTALSAIEHGATKALRNWLIATALLGLAFLAGQAFEFTKLGGLGVSIGGNLFGATFFTLTGFHGAHVLAGVIWIGIVLTRTLQGHVTPSKHEAVELVGLYWHFVDLVWIIIFTVVYLI
jgi:cytochrome c oxidase subunit 3/cytochrome o ubiquinol oxidase subunit 3